MARGKSEDCVPHPREPDSAGPRIGDKKRRSARKASTVATNSYGSDPHGLICGFLFAQGVPGTPLTLEDARRWLDGAAVSGAGAFVWLHFNLSDATAEKWMRAHLPLAPEFFEALKEGSRSTRIEDASDHLVAVMNDVAYEFSFDPSEIATLWLTVSERWAVSARSHPLRSIDRLREAVKQGCIFDSSTALLNHLMHDQGEVLVRIVRESTVQVDAVEDTLARGGLRGKRADLGRLRRVLVRLQRLLAPEPGAMFRLLRQPPTWIGEADLDELRQSTEEFSLVLRDLAALQERIKLLQEEIAAQVGEQTNRSLFTLTVVTVLALPINICAGLFGMNVGGIPWAQDTHGFWWVILCLLLVTLIAGWLAFRSRD